MGTPSKAKATKLTKVQRGDSASPEVFTTVAEVKTFDGPSGTAPEIDVSNFDSTEAESVAGLSVPGELSFGGNFVGSDVQQQGMDADRVAGTKRNWKLVLNDHISQPTTYAFLASVSEFSITGATGGVYEFKAKLKISGTVTKSYPP